MNGKFIVYSKPNCTYCDQAKSLLKSKNLDFVVINLDVGQQKHSEEQYIDRAALLSLFPTAKTMPQISYNEGDFDSKYVGGFAELKAMLSNEAA